MTGRLILLANGFASSKSHVGTPGLIEWMRTNNVRTIAHIGWAEYGFSEKDRHCDQESIASMENEGITVFNIPYPPSEKDKQILCQVDAINLSGGNPGILRHLLRKTDLDRIIRERYASGTHLIGASSGAIVLGSGTLIPTCMFAVKPTKESGISPLVSFGFMGIGMGLHPYSIVPHHGEAWMYLLAFLLSPLFLNLRIKLIPDEKFMII